MNRFKMMTLHIKYILLFTLVPPIKGFDFGVDKDTGSLPRRGHGIVANKRQVKLYSGTRPTPIVCDAEGFQADPVDCSVFHRCMKSGKGRYVSYRCAPGTIYDPDAEICNHPERTTRTTCGTILKEVLKPTYDNEINQEIPTPISTKEPVYLERKPDKIVSTQTPISISELFSTAALIVSPSSTRVPSTSKQTTNPPREPVKNVEFTTPRGISINKPQSTSQTGELCTSDGFMGDSQNCRKFYRCIGNQRGGFLRYEFLCSDPTIWDDDKQSCNHVWAVKRRRCGRGNLIEYEIKSHAESNTETLINRNGEPDRESPITSQIQSQINYGSKVTQTQTQIANGTIKQNQTQVNYDKGHDFKQNQTQISYGIAVSQSQSQINFGDKGMQTQLQIDHLNDSSQMQNQLVEPTSTSSTSTSKNTQMSTDKGPQDKTSTTTTKSPSGECTESGFIGDPNDCKKFYRCVDNGKVSFTRYEFSCSEGTVWDPNLESCNHAWAVKECGGKGSSETSSQSTTQSHTTASQSTTTSSTTSSSYYPPEQATTEENNDIPYGNAPTSSATSKPISPIITASTESQSLHDNKCKSSGFMGDNNDCKKFYRCVDNGNGQYTRYEFNCGDGTVWDSKIDACNHAWAVEKCGGNQNNDNNKEESTTKATQSTYSPQQSTSEITQQNDEFDVGYGSQQDESSTIITLTTTTTMEITSTTTTTETSQNQDLNNENECKESGFIGDSKDCKKFYRCVDNGKGAYTRYEFSCGEGTVWDQKIQSCNHAWAVEKCGGAASTGDIVTTAHNEFENTTSFTTTTTTTTTTQNMFTDDENDVGYGQQSNVTPTSSTTTQSGNQNSDNNVCTSSGFMGDSNDCKKFYRCVDDGKGGYTKYDFDCGDGTVWDQSIESCNHEWAVSKCFQSGNSNNSNNSVESTTHAISISSTTESEDQGYSQQSPVESTTSTSSTSKPPGNKCSQEGFYGDENNCKNFYRCVDNGQGGYAKYEFTCGDGTVWNQEIQACDHESSDKPCRPNNTTNSTQNPYSENDEIVTEATTGATLQSTSKSSTKPEESQPSANECQEEGFYGDSNNCKKFYRCVSNGQGSFTKYEFTCSEGTMWVQEIQACDHDNGITSCTYEDNTSKPTSKPVQSTTLSSQNSSQSQDPDKESGEQSNETTTKPNLEASSSCESEGFYGNENDCTKFYRCIDDGQGGYTKYDFTCGEGTAWDPDAQTCNHIAEVSSCNSNQPQNQPMHDEEASPTTESSSTTKESSSNDSSNNGDNCQQEGYFGNTKDCTKFYRCVDNGKGGYTKYDFDCGEGTIWDQDITTCNHPQDVTHPSCKKNEGGQSSTESTSMGSSSSSSTTESGTMSQTTQSNSDNNSQNTSCSQENSSSKPGQQKYKCEKAGYYADPDDCKKFYRCVDWDGNNQRFSIYHFDCGEGTIWDPALDTCNHEDSVYPPRDCSGTQSQGENMTQDTTTTTEKTTTHESTSSSTTTTQSTQEPTTSEQTTSESTTSSESTTQQSNLEQSSTEQTSTTSQQTTQSSSTSEQTTQSSTSSEQTTQSSTTSEQTTQQSSSTKQTTQQTSSSEQTTTQQSTSSEETTTQSSTTSEQTTQPTTTSEQTTSQQTTTEQTTTEQSTDSGDTTTQLTTTEQQMTTSEQTTSTTEQPDQTTTEEETTENETTTTEGTTTTTTENDSTSTTEATTSDKECPKTEDDQYLYVCPTSFRRHPKYCNMFYQCTEDDDSHEVKIAMFTCPNNTIYDESKTQCVEEKNADKKCNGQKARKHRVKRLNSHLKEPIEVGRSKHSCAAIGYFQFEKENECSSVFLKCLPSKSGKLRGFVYQCPEGYVYWSISKRCEKKERMKYCQGSSNKIWNNRWEIPIERRNLAK